MLIETSKLMITTDSRVVNGKKLEFGGQMINHGQWLNQPNLIRP